MLLRQRLETAEATCRSADPVFSGYLCLLRAASALLGLSEVGQALPSAERALSLFAEARDELAQSIAYYTKGWAQIAIGDFAAGERTCEQSLEHARRIRFNFAEGSTTLYLGLARILGGREQAGVDTLLPLLQDADSLNGFQARIFISMALFRQGRLAEARASAALAVNRSALFPTIQTVALAVLGRIELGGEDFEQAAEHAQRAVQARGECGIDCLVDPMARLTLAEAENALGERERALNDVRLARDRLLQQADSLPEPGQRELYLRNTLDAERTLELARRWLGE